ncbi:MAG: ABC transporter ATP-binding protein [Actinobacteria bacterium]|nr:ABC transporter ATP-binding protein [Actinomycetota bacterium]
MTRELAVQGVSKRFAGVQALEDVSLALRKGEALGLIGPNGSGKTTLLNVVSGVLPSDSGRVALDGEEVTNWDADRVAKAGVARTFQTVRLFGSLSVDDNIRVAVARGSRSDVDGEVASLAERLRLDEWRGTSAATLPYGVQRRVEIARALGIRPAFLLLDEPAAGLNEEESDELLAIVSGLLADSEYGCGVLIIDHDLRLIMRLCDRIHVLNQGKTIAEGPPEEVRRNAAVIEAYLGAEAGEEEGETTEEVR